MYPHREILVFHVESSLHAGAGSNIGHIDNPLQRERSTGNPIVQANGVKGALREFFEDSGCDSKKIEAAFGTANGSDGAGAAAFGEARLLFFPVRSPAGVFSYVTCPSIIARFQRDLVACNKELVMLPDDNGNKEMWNPSGSLSLDQYLAHSNSRVDISSHSVLVLEEIPFKKKTANIDACTKSLASLLFPLTREYQPFKDNFPARTIVLNDEDYIYFVKYSTEVEPHNRIGENGTVDPKTGVWYTEYLPTESILYAPVFIGAPHIKNGTFKDSTEVKSFLENLKGERFWLGGDRTTGKGRVMIHFYGTDDTKEKKEDKQP